MVIKWTQVRDKNPSNSVSVGFVNDGALSLFYFTEHLTQYGTHNLTFCLLTDWGFNASQIMIEKSLWTWSSSVDLSNQNLKRWEKYMMQELSIGEFLLRTIIFCFILSCMSKHRGTSWNIREHCAYLIKQCQLFLDRYCFKAMVSRAMRKRRVDLGVRTEPPLA